jgi:GTP-binding protein
MFIDRVVIAVEGGVGGSGASAFRRESGVPRGGPSGGDGGAGGSVILVCDSQLSTLLDFRYSAEYKAPRGAHGEGSDRTGKSGDDLILRVPPGTIVRDVETEEFLGELLADREQMVVAPGGRGGRGNARFATATQQAPRRWEPGTEGVRRKVELTLKLLADVGLVGEPNAGKSTLLAAVSDARPRVADYPFTTLSPVLGVVALSDYRSFVIADIPGIIEGAHEGRGLGHQFLQHIERTRTLAVLVPVDDEDPQGCYDRLRSELFQYSEELAHRPHCVILSKTDLLAPGDPLPDVEAPEAWGAFALSAATGNGVPELLNALWTKVRERIDEGEEGDGAGSTYSDRGMVSEPEGSDAPPTEEEAWWEALDEGI